jgi:hypothetical protein
VALLVALGGVVAGVAEGILIAMMITDDNNLWLAVSVDRGAALGLFGLVLGGVVGFFDGLLRAKRSAFRPATKEGTADLVK